MCEDQEVSQWHLCELDHTSESSYLVTSFVTIIVAILLVYINKF